MLQFTTFPEENFSNQIIEIPELAGWEIYLLTLFNILIVILVCLIAFWILRFFLRKRHQTSAAFQKVVLLVTVPKEAAEKKGEMERKKTLQEIQEEISVAQALFAAIGGLSPQKGFKTWLLGPDDVFAFEIVNLKGLIHFFLSIPGKYRTFIEQQIHALYPSAQVLEVDDYNIFPKKGKIFGSYLTFKRSFIFPLRTFRRMETDPLEILTNSLAKISSQDGAAIQYVLRPAGKGWARLGTKVAVEMQKGKSAQEALADLTRLQWKKIFSTKEEEKKETRALSAGEQEIQKAIQEKAEQAGLEVNIRLISASEDPEKAALNLADLVNSFNQYNWYEFGNQFTSHKPFFQGRLIRDFIFRRFVKKYSLKISAGEMASLFHFPLPTTETPNIRWLVARKAMPPANMPKEGIILGKVSYRGIETFVRIKKADRRRHVYIIGKSGVGKSVLISNMAKQDIANGEGVGVIDPHGDLVEDILGSIPKERIDDVVYFDPSDTERPIGLNMLDVKREDQKDFAVQEMIAIFYKLFSAEVIGPMFEHNMRNVMLTLMSDPNESGTIVEIPRMFSDPDYQKYWRAKVRDPVVAAFWDKEMARTSDFHKSEMLGYLISKVGRFVENEMMRNIVGQARSSFDLREIMDQKKILLVNLAKGKVGEVNSNLLGLILVSKLQMAAMGRAELPESQRHDFYLYIDEFQNFITDSIATILSEARKYRLNLIIAHQYMGQLVQGQDTKIRDAVLGNAGTMICFRIGVEDAEILAKEFAPVFNEFDLINAEQYTAYVKLLIDNTASRPFNMMTLKPTPSDPELAQRIKEISRLKYGRPKFLVEKEILERSRLGEPEVSAMRAGEGRSL